MCMCVCVCMCRRHGSSTPLAGVAARRTLVRACSPRAMAVSSPQRAAVCDWLSDAVKSLLQAGLTGRSLRAAVCDALRIDRQHWKAARAPKLCQHPTGAVPGRDDGKAPSGPAGGAQAAAALSAQVNPAAKRRRRSRRTHPLNPHSRPTMQPQVIENDTHFLKAIRRGQAIAARQRDMDWAQTELQEQWPAARSCLAEADGGCVGPWRAEWGRCPACRNDEEDEAERAGAPGLDLPLVPLASESEKHSSTNSTSTESTLSDALGPGGAPIGSPPGRGCVASYRNR